MSLSSNAPATMPAPIRPPAWLDAAPLLFVLLWSTGFVSPKFGLPYADPLTFVGLRFAIVFVLFAALALASRAPWPKTGAEWAHGGVVAVFFHVTYLSGVFVALKEGVSTSVTALIVGIQPLLTAAGARWFLGEHARPRQWFGLGLGLAGVALVVGDKISLGVGTPLGYGLAAMALGGVTFGTLYQKRFLSGMDLRTGAAVQYLFGALAMAVIAPIFEDMRIDWTIEFVLAIAYICVIVSFLGVSVFFYMLRTRQAIRVVSLFYLIPPVTALLGYLLFGETMSLTALAGMALVVAGVALVNRA